MAIQSAPTVFFNESRNQGRRPSRSITVVGPLSVMSSGVSLSVCELAAQGE